MIEKMKRLGLIAGVVALVLAPLLVRTAVDGRAELARADEAGEAGDRDAEIRHLGRAARFRLPLAQHDDQAINQLHALAVDAQSAGEITTSLTAWRELRSALIGTRTLDVPEPELLAEANAEIVELMVEEARASNRPIARDRWAEELEQDLQPRHRTLLAALSFAAWLVSCIGFLARGIDAKGRLIPRPALRWGGSALLLLILWILLM